MNPGTPSLGALLNELHAEERRLAEDNDVEGQEQHADEDFVAAEARATTPRPPLLERLRARLQPRRVGDR
jgi:hypothetical protein